MSIPRVAAWCALAVAITASSIGDAAPTVPPVFVEGFRVVAADLHVHALLGDGALPAWDIRREARRRGLDVVALTNHNQMHMARLDRALFPEAQLPLTLAAEELTAFGYHLTAIGIREPVDWRLPLAGAVRAIHAQGGIAIAAHAIGRFGEQIDDEALALLDGLEVAHPAANDDPSARGQLDALYARATRIKPTIAPIGASDYHFDAPVGSCRTLIFVRDLTAEGVFEAIRAGRTVAYDTAGNAYGQPAWISAAAAIRPAVETPSPDTARQAFCAALAWLALVFLVTFGRGGNIP